MRTDLEVNRMVETTHRINSPHPSEPLKIVILKYLEKIVKNFLKNVNFGLQAHSSSTQRSLLYQIEDVW